MRISLLISTIFLTCTGILAQSTQTILALDRNDDIPVFSIDSIQLKFPTTGGFNYMQAGAIDLNNDGIQDLLMFDRTGDRILPFIYTGTPGNPDYRFDHSLVYSFPKVKDFLIVKDFNCDGKADLFTYENSGFKVYKNISSASGLQFELYTESLQSYFNPATLAVFCIPVDVPVVEDMDNDGDQDLLVFGILGTCVEYHRNMAVEQLGRCDTLMLKLESDNWGLFTESFSTNDVVINDSCDHPTGRNNALRHAGSTMLAYDADGDGDKDMLLGDIAYRTMTQLINGGNANYGQITSSQTPFPSGTPYINLPIFPAAFFLDYDHDGIRDLIVSPNNEGGSENHLCIWYYHNDGTDAIPVFTFVQKDLLLDESLDFGEGCIPTFFDYNGDGLQDIVIGNYGYFQPAGTYKSQLALMKNISTDSSPKFKLVETDFAGLGQLTGNTTNYHPSFGDVDGDSDQDMVLGTSDGRIFYYINEAAPGNDANFVFSSPHFQGIDIGTYSAPQLIDVDTDGLLDMLIGCREGTIHYYKNFGTPTNMILQEVNTTFGQVSTAENGDPNGFSTPTLFRKSGVSYLLCGSLSGRFRLYSGIDGNLSGAFVLEDSLLLGTSDGERTSISLKDLNDDGFLDAVTGNYSGGINFFSGVFPSSLEDKTVHEPNFVIFPNPGSDLYVRSLQEKIKQIEVFDMQGRMVHFQSGTNQPTVALTDLQLDAGIYFVRVKGAQNTQTFKWIRKK
jgi:hypothetical protein